MLGRRGSGWSTRRVGCEVPLPAGPNGRVQHDEARLQAFDVDERREPDRAVAVQLDGAPCRDEVRRELAHRFGRQQAPGILR